jgi:dipeptidyl aminopeptidase/acylaminoacyl peptidase
VPRKLAFRRAHSVNCKIMTKSSGLSCKWWAAACAFLLVCNALCAEGLKSNDLYRFRAVTEVRFSPDGQQIAYTVMAYDRPGRPYTQLWMMNAAGQNARRIGGEKVTGSSPRWSRDGRWLAFEGGEIEGKSGIAVVHADGTELALVATTTGTNSPLPGQGDDFSWSPDGKSIVFVSSTPGPETAEAAGDPMVISRYLYKPTASEGLTHFNDNRRLHLFVVDLSSKQIQQLTSGNNDEHSVDWSPNGDEVLFVSNREPNSDEFFNYDVFKIRVSDKSIQRVTASESAEYAPMWSPDGQHIAFLGTKRGLTDRETTMEDTHAWVMDADGKNRREIGAAIDNRQQLLQWTPDGSALYFVFQERGSTKLAKVGLADGSASRIVDQTGSVGDFSISKKGDLAYAFTSLTDMAELQLVQSGAAAKAVTNLNADVLAGKQVAAVEPFTFVSNDNKYEVEAFLTRPVEMKEGAKYPLIVNLHGGPHGQNGPMFAFKDQAYAAKGYGVLHVNYRGSTGYGQKFADAVFADQNGYEAQDVLYGVNAAVRRNLWIDRDRMGVEGVSYGGQLSDWLITQTNEFKAAIPIAGIANLISYNYMTYYNQYEEMEFGQFLHQGRLMDEAWERSALKHVANVHTPTMLVHGENDPDVPIAEAEQFYIALKDVGVDTIFVRYPREGHGLHETKHQIDLIDRSFVWYERHFPKTGTNPTTNVQP